VLDEVNVNYFHESTKIFEDGEKLI